MVQRPTMSHHLGPGWTRWLPQPPRPTESQSAFHWEFRRSRLLKPCSSPAAERNAEVHTIKPMLTFMLSFFHFLQMDLSVVWGENFFLVRQKHLISKHLSNKKALGIHENWGTGVTAVWPDGYLLPPGCKLHAWPYPALFSINSGRKRYE